MAIKGLKSTQLANDPTTSALKFNFKTYEQKNSPFYNNSTNIDFVTYNGSLYVCVENGISFKAGDPANNGFLLLVEKGKDGRQGVDGKEGPMGPMPNYTLSFDGKQMVVVEQPTGIRKAVSPDLTGPVWVPELHDKKIVWTKEESSANTRPADIDLEQLRPVEERPLLLRTNSDNTKRSDESSGPANVIQWKHEGDEYWTNLISISELMNLTLAGVSFWQDEEDDNSWHFGHKEVLKATYSSSKDATKIVAVELGDVLYDAGKVPFPDNSIDLEAIRIQLNDLDRELQLLNLRIPTRVGQLENDVPYLKEADLSTYAKKSDIPTDYVKSVKLNGESHSPVNGIVDLGNVSGGSGTVDAYTKTESDARYIRGIKVNNGKVLPKDTNGIVNIIIGDSGTSLFDIRFDSSTHKLQKTTDGQTWTDLVDLDDFGGTDGSGLSESEVKHLVGQILEGTLDSAIPEYVKGADHNYFIRLNDLADYTTRDVVAAMIRDAMTDQNVDYYRVFTLYQRTNSPSSAPAKPVTGVWEWNTAAEVDNIALKPNASSAWSNHPENATTSTPYLWMTSATYSYLTKSEVGDWETPICLTGEPGNDGSDGNGVEFIYTLVDSLAEFNALTTPIAPGSGPDSYPDPWQDHPEGVSEEHPIEAASVRKYNGVTEQWEAYCEPFIWSKWGEDGVDGDGVEYIFHVDASDILSNNLIPAQTLDDIYYKTNNQIDYSRPKPGYENYDTSDWVPDGQNGRPDQNWSDNPSDVDEQQPYEWVSIRKYNGQAGHWGPFSEPKIWGLWGQKTVIQQEVVSGTTVYKSYNCYAFTRTNLDISGYRVTGGQAYDNPLDGIVTKNGNTTVQMTWSDGIPNGTEQLWSIQALIGDESQSSDAAWSSPARVGDRPGFQVEFAASNTNTDAVYNKTKTLPSLNNYLADTPEGVDEVAWRNATSTANCGSWSDTSDDNTVYMAESRIVAGSWTPWNVIKIKGETGRQGPTGPQGRDGSDGADGTDIEFVYYRTANENQRPGMSATEGSYDGTTASSEDPYLDDFLPKATANGFELQDGTYWHDHPSGVNENLTCEWVGVRHSSYQNGIKIWNAFNIALWSKYGANGRDGDGIEYVFWGLSEEQNSQITCTWPTQKESNAENGGCNVDPTRSYNNKSIDDPEYLPAILINNVKVPAVDDNPGIENYKYVYASKRKYNGSTGTWGEFSEIKLWNEQSDSELNNVVLDITNDTHPIYVDEEGRITDRYMSHSGYSTGSMYLYRNLVLLSNAEVFISDGSTDVQIVSRLKEPVENNCYKKVSGSYLTMTQHGVTATVTASYVWKYDDSNSSKVELKVAFNKNDNKNPILTDSFDIIIKVKSTVGDYIGTDVLRLVPKHSDKEIELLSVPRTQRTSSEGSHDYSDSEFNFYGYYGDDVYPTLDLLSKTHYFFKYDDQANWTEFYIPLSDYTNPNYQKLHILQNQYDRKAEATSEYTHFYFDINGNSVSSSNDAFYEIWLYNTDFKDNDHGQWTRWSMQAYVYPAKFVANEDYPINELYFGVGFNNGPIDEANVHIVYPGKDGKQGPVGPVGPAGKDGKDGKDGEPGKTVVTYQYLNGKVIRMSNWTDNQLEYSNGETAVDGVYYLDVVKYVSGSTTSYYKCISDVTYTNSNKPVDPSDDSNNWELFIPQSDAWFETMLANSAYIENLTSKQVVITDNNNIVAGMASDTDIAAASDNQTVGNVRIWAGTPTTDGDLTTAPFTVEANGKLTATNADVSGNIDASSGKIGAIHISSTGFSSTVNTTTDYGSESSNITFNHDYFDIGDSLSVTNYSLDPSLNGHTFIRDVQIGHDSIEGYVDIVDTTPGGRNNSGLYVNAFGLHVYSPEKPAAWFEGVVLMRTAIDSISESTKAISSDTSGTTYITGGSVTTQTITLPYITQNFYDRGVYYNFVIANANIDPVINRSGTNTITTVIDGNVSANLNTFTMRHGNSYRIVFLDGIWYITKQ